MDALTCVITSSSQLHPQYTSSDVADMLAMLLPTLLADSQAQPLLLSNRNFMQATLKWLGTASSSNPFIWITPAGTRCAVRACAVQVAEALMSTAAGRQFVRTNELLLHSMLCFYSGPSGTSGWGQLLVDVVDTAADQNADTKLGEQQEQGSEREQMQWVQEPQHQQQQRVDVQQQQQQEQEQEQSFNDPKQQQPEQQEPDKGFRRMAKAVAHRIREHSHFEILPGLLCSAVGRQFIVGFLLDAFLQLLTRFRTPPRA